MLGLSVRADGHFTISLDGANWLAGADYAVAGLSTANGTLVLTGAPTTSTGSDELGSYASTTLHWARKQDGSAEIMRTTFRHYTSDDAIVFEQFFPHGYTPSSRASASFEMDEASPSEGAITTFPSFARNPGFADLLPCFAYHGVFPALEPCTFGNYTESHQGGVPLVIYDRKNTSLPMMVMSPLHQAKAQHMATSPSMVGTGIKGTVDHIPAGWSHTFLLSAGVGIRDGMMAWGDRLLALKGGKRRADLYRDTTHSTIGFWTDNGGYYHYNTGSSLSYEQVLPQVKAYHDQIGVPFGHWQFDSWFYPKDGSVSPGGGGGGVTNWTAMPSVFPSGMAAIQVASSPVPARRPARTAPCAQSDPASPFTTHVCLRCVVLQYTCTQAKLGGMPMVMHNRQWSPHSDYIRRLPQFHWYKGPKWAVPAEPEAFFDWFFHQQVRRLQPPPAARWKPIGARLVLVANER